MKVNGFIFDLDGVIVFTDEYHYQAWKQVADEMGVYFDKEINNRLRGVSRMESLDIILENHKQPGSLSDNDKIQIAEKKNMIYRGLLSKMSPHDVSKDVRDTLSELKKMGYKLAIGSSSKNAKYILEKTELNDYFDAVSDGTKIEKSKPDPEVFIKAAEYISLNPRECLVVEDAIAGIDAANSGDMISIGIGDAAKYSKCRYVIESLSDLISIVKDQN